VTGPQVAERVSTLELFFDLVFVFTVTQLTAVLTHDLTLAALGQVVVMLALIWWMYAGYAWLTNAVSTRGAARRAVLLGGMAAYLVLALAIPDAFHGTGLTFGLGYLFVVCIHASLFLFSSSAANRRAFRNIASANLFTAGLVVLGGALGGTAQGVLWAAAALLEWVSPSVANRERQTGFVIGAAHFVERHGLVIIVAIGESVVAVGIGAAGLAVDGELVLAAVLGLALSATLWWAYFGADDDERAEGALTCAPPERQPLMALNGFGRAHYVLLLGIVLVAVGLKKATGHAYDELTGGQALALGAGVAVFLLGDVWFRHVLDLGRSAWRVIAAAGALATVPVGSALAAVLQLATLVAIVGGALLAEALTTAQARARERPAAAA
jgi:low temperature requirement protein LtrA